MRRPDTYQIYKGGLKMSNMTNARAGLPVWFWAAAGLGLAWNVFGTVQFLGTLSSTPESLAAAGMTPEQAAVMLGYPSWMTIAFGVGVFGGVIGCVLLLLKKKLSVAVFVISLIGYVILYIGDITQGVFAALGTPQIVILSLVVLIAAALLWLSRKFSQSGMLA
jgi:hypothetical protein